MAYIIREFESDKLFSEFINEDVLPNLDIKQLNDEFTNSDLILNGGAGTPTLVKNGKNITHKLMMRGINYIALVEVPCNLCVSYNGATVTYNNNIVTYS